MTACEDVSSLHEAAYTRTIALSFIHALCLMSTDMTVSPHNLLWLRSKQCAASYAFSTQNSWLQLSQQPARLHRLPLALL